jgi:hypothetical protein
MPCYDLTCLKCGRVMVDAVIPYTGIGQKVTLEKDSCKCGNNTMVRTKIELTADMGKRWSLDCGTAKWTETPMAKQALSCKGFDPTDKKQLLP